jgi:hypothetical protein
MKPEDRIAQSLPKMVLDEIQSHKQKNETGPYFIPFTNISLKLMKGHHAICHNMDEPDRHYTIEIIQKQKTNIASSPLYVKCKRKAWQICRV